MTRERKSIPEVPALSVEHLEKLLTLQDVADLLQVSVRTVQRLIDSDELTCLRIGRQVRFRPQMVNRWLDNA